MSAEDTDTYNWSHEAPISRDAADASMTWLRTQILKTSSGDGVGANGYVQTAVAQCTQRHVYNTEVEIGQQLHGDDGAHSSCATTRRIFLDNV